MPQHFLLVGQGLAGSLLAHTLIEYEQRVSIVDRFSANSASHVAAGIINPLTGQRMVVSPEVRQCLPVALEYYEKLAEQFHQTFYFPNPMLRLYKDQSDKDRYRARRNDTNYQEYLGTEFLPGQSEEPLNDPFGGFHQKQTGHLNIQILLNSLRNYFKQHADFIDAEFNYTDLEIGADGILWQGQRYDHVIFCEGATAVNNPWFRWLPFQLSKGELITIESQDGLSKKIVNKGYWLLPITDHMAKVGASYMWDWTDDRPTAIAREQLLTFCHTTLLNFDSLSVVDHRSAIRPTTKDKQPFIGTHPEYAHMHCFNGFGSKGGLLIPFYAQRFSQYLLSNITLPDHVNIHRFFGTDSLVVLARRFISERVIPGDIAIDATVGNGYDTELLARCVGDKGRVYGFDIQQTAIKNTRQRLTRERLLDRVTLITADHANMAQNLDDEIQQKVSIVVFNLGFLPGSDKSCTTLAETTLLAMKQAIKMLEVRGSVIVITYAGHECGKKETELVRSWIKKLDNNRFTCRTIDAEDKIDAPSLIIITKIKN